MNEAPLTVIAGNPSPQGGRSLFVEAVDGWRLRAGFWLPAGGPKRTRVLLQGGAAFIEKYFETIRMLQARRFAVATVDWRGQGLSGRVLADPRKHHIDDFALYSRDFE